MKINKRQIGLITDTVGDLFYRLKARLLGRFFTGPHIYFDVLTDTDPMDTLEGTFVFTIKTLYGPNASVDEDMLKNLCDITSNFIEAQRLKAVNHALNDAKQAETAAELATKLTNTIEQSGNYVNMLTNTQTRVVQAYAERSGIQQLSASMGIEDATVIFLGVNDAKRCKHCRKMYSDPANARQPIPYKLSQVREGYFRPKEHDGVTPFMPPLHPRCREVMSFVPPNFTIRANGVIAFKAFGYDYYSDYHGVAKSETMYESHSDAFMGFDEFIQYSMEHPCKCGCESLE